MPHSELHPEYTLKLSRSEHRLVMLALAGKLTDADRRAALELNVHLLHQRTVQIKQLQETAVAALTNAKNMLKAEPMPAPDETPPPGEEMKAE